MKKSITFLTQYHILSAAVTTQEIKSGCSLVTPDLWWLGFPGALSLLARDTLSNTTCDGKFLPMSWHLTLPASELILAVAFCLPSPNCVILQAALDCRTRWVCVAAQLYFPGTVTASCPILISVPQAIHNAQVTCMRFSPLEWALQKAMSMAVKRGSGIFPFISLLVVGNSQWAFSSPPRHLCNNCPSVLRTLNILFIYCLPFPLGSQQNSPLGMNLCCSA